LSAPGVSRYFVPVELLTGTVGSPIRMPYVPNSMVMDRLGSNLYFGSERELMVYTTSGNALKTEDSSVPGVVLAVSPTNNQVLINDQTRRILYIYSPSSGVVASNGGIGYAAAWTPDAKTLYVAGKGNNASGVEVPMMFVYTAATGWSSHDLSATGTATNLAVMVPGIGAYLSGNPTVVHTWCPAGTVGKYATMDFYPLSDSVAAQTDVLAATVDGAHILGAAMASSGVTLNDIGIDISKDVPSGACPTATNNVLKALTLTHSLNTLNLSKVSATAVNQIVPSPASNLAFITYTGTSTGAELPYYVPGKDGAAGTVSYLALTGGSLITAPLAGAFSPDNKLFFVSTSGDNKVHYIDIATDPTKPADTKQISPGLPACTPVASGGVDVGCTYTGSEKVVPATEVTVKPRTTT
jgi:hypothetical protein